MDVDPQKTALVLIEYQNDFTSEGGALHDAVKGVMGENEMLAVAAYNAGTGNVDKWIARNPDMLVPEIPFPETRHYVAKVLDVREDYESTYARELGL